jgi:hypothetical protein
MVVLENYKKALKSFVEKNNNQRVMLFAVLKMDEHVDKWSVLLSVDWITDDNRQSVFSGFITALQDNLSTDELDEVARIVFYSPDEHLVNLFFEKFKEGQYIKEDAKLNGNVIHEGYIITLNKGPAVADQAALL